MEHKIKAHSPGEVGRLPLPSVADQAIADPIRIIICSNEKTRQGFLDMGVPLKQTWVVPKEFIETRLDKMRRFLLEEAE